MEAKEHVGKLSCTVFILNVNDIFDMKSYYHENFDIKLETSALVRHPEMLNVRHLPDNMKEKLIKKYDKKEEALFLTELYKDRNETIFQNGLYYIKKLSSFRKMDVSKLWSEFDL